MIVAALAAVALTGCASTTGSFSATGADSHSAAPVATKGVGHQILLAVTVSGGMPADITYTDPTDDTIQQATVTAGWSKQFTGRAGMLGQLLQLSVQGGVSATDPTASGSVSCTITVDGAVRSTHSATGYNIADCSYNMPG